MHGSELIIRTQREQHVREVIPISALLDDFPRAFVEDYVHWLDPSTQTIEWRSMKNMWVSSLDNWHMHQYHDSYVLSRGTHKLLDIRSPTVQAISSILNPLELATNIHVVIDCRTEALEIHLPRMKLDFLLKDATSLLESKQFRGMVLDECQSIGTFTGLVNKLVLRDTRSSSRCIIVPHGDVSVSSKGYHVEVRIVRTSAAHVHYHTYQIDSTLGKLDDNSLQSKLFKLYLHATTSHCLADQLTGRTGTEEALYGLEGAAARSFVALEPAESELLKKFTRLTPKRQFYPDHLRVMQQVEWSVLPSLSQHSAFYPYVASILDHDFQVPQESAIQIPSVNRGDKFLLERAAIRNSSFQVHGFGADVAAAVHDVVYTARDQTSDSERELQACRTARLVNDWSQNLRICPQLLSEIESWAKPILNPNREENPKFGFDLALLDVPSKVFRKQWCTLHNYLSHARIERDKYRIMTLLSSLSYSQYAKQELVETLLAFATFPDLRQVLPPSYTQFQLTDGYSPDEQRLIRLAKEHVRGFYECPESMLPSFLGESEYVAEMRRRQKYESSKDEHVRAFVRELLFQGLTANPQPPSKAEYSKYIGVQNLMEKATSCFESWHRNDRFRTYIQQTQAFLDRLRPARQNMQPYSFSQPPQDYVPPKTYVKFVDLTMEPAPRFSTDRIETFEKWIVRDGIRTTDDGKLEELLCHIFSRCTNSHDQQYAAKLCESFKALLTDCSTELRLPTEWTLLLEANLRQAKQDFYDKHQTICDSLQKGLHKLVRTAKMLPRLSRTSLLSHLANDRAIDLPNDWKVALVKYGLSITATQRAERLVAAAMDRAELLSELENPGHENWNPMNHPEWLLLEIENNIMIRQEQARIAREMIAPTSGSNSVMQLNMGLGKSSVIVPMVAAALADRTQLARVIVLKPLAMQMFQLLVKKLGGMINKRIVYMPISRSLNLNVSEARQIRRVYEACKQAGAIVLLQPEHILSFELMGLERLSANSELGGVMVEDQCWLNTNSRDILDESDEILSVKFELIYTIGTQRALEFSPERWSVIQHVLGVMGDLASKVHEQYPHGLEVIPAQPGGFPRIRILEAQAGDELLEGVVRQLCKIGLRGVNIWKLPQKARDDLFRFITDPSLDVATKQSIQKLLSSESMKSGVLLLRGLFACGVLKFTLEQKRWRVNYGLDPSRTRLAVPYHAKDSPAARAEFSHPDATITLTCLSYYYNGLSDEEILASFKVLLLSDHAKEEYEQWVKDAPCLPPRFKHLTGVNLSNLGQCFREVFPPLRFSKSIVDFYMSTIVFPAEMKEFPHKLSSSGWDIAREKCHPTTGFSGTNDSRYILPLSISQHDLPEQLSTNAAVLRCLLRPENTFAEITQFSNAGILDAEVLLKIVAMMDPSVRVVLDVGAQVLELQNEAFASAWLERVPESKAQAVIFFDTQNKICVLSRDGSKELLQISPFAKQIDQCLVYLDESHTRGTDLKLPVNYRAIVTLGPGLTKDRLVQGRVSSSSIFSC
jgi:hypothetical protein